MDGEVVTGEDCHIPGMSARCLYIDVVAGVPALQERVVLVRPGEVCGSVSLEQSPVEVVSVGLDEWARPLEVTGQEYCGSIEVIGRGWGLCG